MRLMQIQCQVVDRLCEKAKLIVICNTKRVFASERNKIKTIGNYKYAIIEDIRESPQRD